MPAKRSVFVTTQPGHSQSSRFRYTSAHRGLMKRPQINPYEVPNYTIEESARYLHVHEEKIAYWVIGTEDAAPLSTTFSRCPTLLCFKNLVECFVLESLRNVHGLSLQAIRESLEELRLEKPSKYPLADYQLATRGGRLIYLDEGGNELICLTKSGQLAFRDILFPFLKRVERNEQGIAKRLFPFTRKEHLKSPMEAPRCVVIDPNVAFGMPVLINSRISTAFLLSRKKGGASIPTLAADYGRPVAEIEEALRLEEVV
jgi:uncharacterized protein (DUF433 family)